MSERKISVNIFDNQKLYKFSTRDISNTVRLVLKKEKEAEKVSISVIFIEDEEMRQLNQTYRKIDKATDVLSFNCSNDIGDVTKETVRDLGDIFISVETLIRQATEEKTEVLHGLLRVVIHGVLHLCGYDHEQSEEEEEIMMRKQDDYFLQIKTVMEEKKEKA